MKMAEKLWHVCVQICTMHTVRLNKNKKIEADKTQQNLNNRIGLSINIIQSLGFVIVPIPMIFLSKNYTHAALLFCSIFFFARMRHCPISPLLRIHMHYFIILFSYFKRYTQT